MRTKDVPAKVARFVVDGAARRAVLRALLRINVEDMAGDQFKMSQCVCDFVIESVFEECFDLKVELGVGMEAAELHDDKATSWNGDPRQCHSTWN